jgi:ethanolamine utilization microcompartment shell protein EutL
MFELDSESQAEVLQAGEAVLTELDLAVSERKAPQIASMQVITNVSPYQSQLLNRFTRGMMLVAGQTMLVLECTPAAYINLAANEAEKAAPVNLMHVTSVGVYGRLWMAGSEADILAARDAAVSSLEGIDGRA